jgi:hypothetical protein
MQEEQSQTEYIDKKFKVFIDEWNKTHSTKPDVKFVKKWFNGTMDEYEAERQKEHDLARQEEHRLTVWMDKQFEKYKKGLLNEYKIEKWKKFVNKHKSLYINEPKYKHYFENGAYD